MKFILALRTESWTIVAPHVCCITYLLYRKHIFEVSRNQCKLEWYVSQLALTNWVCFKENGRMIDPEQLMVGIATRHLQSLWHPENNLSHSHLAISTHDWLLYVPLQLSQQKVGCQYNQSRGVKLTTPPSGTELLLSWCDKGLLCWRQWMLSPLPATKWRMKKWWEGLHLCNSNRFVVDVDAIYTKVSVFLSTHCMCESAWRQMPTCISFHLIYYWQVAKYAKYVAKHDSHECLCMFTIPEF